MTETPGYVMHFERGAISASRLEPVVQEAWARGITAHLSRETGADDQDDQVDVRDVELDIRAGHQIAVTESGQGFSDVGVEILVTVSLDVSLEVIKAIWRNFVSPALEEEFGHRPVGRHVADHGRRVRPGHHA